MIRGLTSTTPSLKNHSKIKENGLSDQNFSSPAALCEGFAQGTVGTHPESATLAVTIIPVSRPGLAHCWLVRSLTRKDR